MNNIFPNIKKIVIDTDTGQIFDTDQRAEKFQEGFKFTQTSASNIWNVKHNLGSYEVFVQIFIDNEDGSQTQVYPEITFIDPNSISINFNSAYVTGMASILFFGEVYTVINNL